jgi:hypothetical protein
MYSRGNAAETPELARQLARPRADCYGPDAVALLRVATADAHDRHGHYRRLVNEVILDITPYDADC